MTTIDPGHSFAFDNFDGPGQQVLDFMKREGPGYPGNVGHHTGTNMQEVVRGQIHRARYLDWQVPCDETEEFIRLQRRSLIVLESRHARRAGLAPMKINALVPESVPVEDIPYCRICGHWVCRHERT